MAGFREGSGLRSEGGIRSGLEETDLPGSLVHSNDVTLAEAATEPPTGVWNWIGGSGLFDCLAGGGVLVDIVGGSVGWD